MYLITHNPDKLLHYCAMFVTPFLNFGLNVTGRVQPLSFYNAAKQRSMFVQALIVSLRSGKLFLMPGADEQLRLPPGPCYSRHSDYIKRSLNRNNHFNAFY